MIISPKKIMITLDCFVEDQLVFTSRFFIGYSSKSRDLLVLYLTVANLGQLGVRSQLGPSII